MTENPQSGTHDRTDEKRNLRLEAHRLLDRLLEEVAERGFHGHVALELHGKDGRLLRLLDHRVRHHRTH